eukprot:TRINITY_DN12041_c0_g1_i1.p1 TRINITY_DN12041_c0_g1~~TRINITY_DN12041_c0_g1_i1.p1  ORF type:complete len:487 (+),score=92.05 TRINITY_DN12041_c0_g1_i1:45-1505(+)
MIRDFEILGNLGEGAYSSVYKVRRCNDEQLYALKRVKMDGLSDKERANALNEVRILASIRHPNVVCYKEVFIEEETNSLCIVMEFADDGDLYGRIVQAQKKGQLLPEAEIWRTFVQMVRGLKSLHQLNILHRDLKSANIFLFKDGSAKLGDLNVSKIAKRGLLYTQTGTPYYASPEVWKDMPYDLRADMWSLGCVVYEMTTLKPPFRAENMEELYKRVIRGIYPKIPGHFSQDLSTTIRNLLQVDPSKRPSCDQLLSSPAVVQRLDEKYFVEADEGAHTAMLKTIRMPKSLDVLADKLPKPNYRPLKTRKIDKEQFLMTLAVHGEMDGRQSVEDPPKLLTLPQLKKPRESSLQPLRGEDDERRRPRNFSNVRDGEDQEDARPKAKEDRRKRANVHVTNLDVDALFPDSPKPSAKGNEVIPLKVKKNRPKVIQSEAQPLRGRASQEELLPSDDIAQLPRLKPPGMRMSQSPSPVSYTHLTLPTIYSV